MKINDTYPVMIAGQVVAQARITGLEDGKATLIIPATQVVMATRTELTVEEPEPASVQILTDEPVREEPVEEAPKAEQQVEQPAAVVETAPVVEESNVSE